MPTELKLLFRGASHRRQQGVKNRWGYQCFFIIMLMAHSIQQLVAKGALLRRFWKQIGTLTNLAMLLAAEFTAKLFDEWFDRPSQIRLRPDG